MEACPGSTSGERSGAPGLQVRQILLGEAPAREALALGAVEPGVRQLLHRWIETEGLVATEAESAEQALSLVPADDSPAVAFCDVRMPGHGGMWLAERLRIEHPTTAVVLTTGHHTYDR